MIKHIVKLGLLFSAVVMFSCSGSNSKQPDRTIPPKFAQQHNPGFTKHGELVILNNEDTLQTLDVEIVNDPERRAKGLMYRKTMEENQGMLFIFDVEELQSFWMKNTYLALDLLFINSNKEIVHIHKNAQPMSIRSIPSIEPSLYVLEVNAGYCDKYFIEAGHYIDYKWNQP